MVEGSSVDIQECGRGRRGEVSESGWWFRGRSVGCDGVNRVESSEGDEVTGRDDIHGDKGRRRSKA